MNPRAGGIRGAALVADVLGHGGAPALGGAVFDADGTLFLEVAGVRRAGQAAPVTRVDRWHLGSNTKAMTAFLYARQVERGRASWGATLGGLFPDLTVHPGLAGRTVEELMSHRAGLSDRGVLGEAWLASARLDPRPPTAQRRALAASALSRPPAGRPGRFRYANLNFVVAGAAIEQVAGRSWEEAIAADLFDPLGMTSAGFGAPRGAAPWGHEASGRAPVDPTGPADNPPALGPAGTVHASLEDYGRFLRLFLNRGGGVARPETMVRLVEVPGTVRASRGWLGLLSSERYWLGWVNSRGGGRSPGPALGHEGSNTLWHALAAVAPSQGIAIAAVSNDGAAGRRATRALAARLARRFAPAA